MQAVYNKAMLKEPVRAALQSWADHVSAIAGQAEPAENVVELKRA